MVRGVSLRCVFGLFLVVLAGCEGGETAAGGPGDAQPSAGDAGGGCVAACEGARRCDADGVAQVCADYDGDGCAEWGGDVPCLDGTTCSEGACVAACDHACAEGEAVCGGGGIRRCAVAADGCRALGAPEPCGEGLRCDDGACVEADRPCVATCDADGARQCGDGGYQRCGQFDEDACLEWSVTIPCGAGETCADGECLPDCTDECGGGEVSCSGDGFTTCGNHDRDICLEPGPVIGCGADERCDDGRCVPVALPCEDACDAEGASVCAEGGAAWQRCGQYDADECLELSPAVACAGFERCEAGACVPVCEDECGAGARRCGGGGAQICGNFDHDPCLEWAPAEACGEGERCDDGRCVRVDVPCEDACAADARRCGAAGVEVCGNFDDDACREWSPAVACGEGERCEGEGECVADCADECAPGEAACAGNGVSVCGNFDADPCLEPGPPQGCPAGQSCSDGQCRLDCVDECAADGARACVAGVNAVRLCGAYDADACRDWSSPLPCRADEACVDGRCVAVCRDECAAGDRRCLGDGYEVCGDFDADDCLEFGGGEACGAGQTCEAGACNTPCRDECPGEGAGDCPDAGSSRACGNFDADACFEWSVARACGLAEACVDGACAPRPPPARPVIDEVLFDAEGADAPGVFVELWGPPGTALAGFSLVGINGTNGEIYARIPLAGAIPPDGSFVVAHPDAAPALAGQADQFHAGADLQNGPDSVQLRWGDLVVDALGYGDFADARFAGEGTPAGRVQAGQSLARDARHTDTGDNAADFRAGPPSPGAGTAGCEAACAEAGATRCSGAVAERCAAGAGGCLVWTPVEDCGADDRLCQDGACVAPQGCAVPDGIQGPVANLADMDAQDQRGTPIPSIDVLPIAGGFAVAAGSVDVARFALLDLDARVQAGPVGLGTTRYDLWGTRDAYPPSIVFTGEQYVVAWSAFSDAGNRDIVLTRLTPEGQTIGRRQMIVSQRKGFNPVIRGDRAGLQVFFNAYAMVDRIDLNVLGERQGDEVTVTSVRGDTRERGYVRLATSAQGGRGLAFLHAVEAFGTPHLWFRPLDADGRPAGDERAFGEVYPSATWPGLFLFAHPRDGYLMLWQARLADAVRTRVIFYARLAADGAPLQTVRLDQLDPPADYLPNMDVMSVHFDGERIGVVHRREHAREPAHFAIQWMGLDGASLGRTELGQDGGVLTRHPEDGAWRLFIPGNPIRVARLGCAD